MATVCVLRGAQWLSSVHAKEVNCPGGHSGHTEPTECEIGDNRRLAEDDGKR